jgi:hypothetical protein
MQQRTKRLLMIWLGVVAYIVAFMAMGLGAGWIISQLPTEIAIAVIIVVVIVYAGWLTFQIAKVRLTATEFKEARILRELSKGYDE